MSLLLPGTMAYVTACLMHNTSFVYCFLPELNECDPDPCLNGGTCVDGVRNYTCNCASFTVNSVEIYHTGRNCDTREK